MTVFSFQRLHNSLTMGIKALTGKWNVLPYLCSDRGAGHLADLTIVTGAAVIGGQRHWQDRQRKVHRLVMCALVPDLPVEIDQIILPDESPDILTRILTFLYCGRWVCYSWPHIGLGT